MTKKRVSASIEFLTIQGVLKIAKDNKRSFSAMVNILLIEAIAFRKEQNLSQKKQ